MVFRTCLNSSLAVICLCGGTEPRPVSTVCVERKEQGADSWIVAYVDLNSQFWINSFVIVVTVSPERKSIMQEIHFSNCLMSVL